MKILGIDRRRLVDNGNKGKSLVDVRKRIEKGADEIFEYTSSLRHTSKFGKLRDKEDLPFRERCGRIVNNERVQLVMVLLITVNAILMGVGTYDFVTENPKVDHVFEEIDDAFLIIFTIELAMQLIYHGWDLFFDGWLIFDFTIIFASWAFQSVQVIRAFRIFRALRLITRIKHLRDLVAALLEAMPRLTAILLLMILIFYIFAVMFTTMFMDTYADGVTDRDFFGSLDKTFYTLFQIMTLDWSDVARPIVEVNSWAWLPSLLFISISSFIVFNIIIAVMCDAVSVLDDDEEENQLILIKKKKDLDFRASVDRISENILTLKGNQDKLQENLETLTQLLSGCHPSKPNSNTRRSMY